MFTIDPRLKSIDRVATRKDYSVNPYFNAISSNASGGLALGSIDGKIRLYKDLGSNAKTLLPGLGDPIISVEVSRDGCWVLATTRTYLLIIPTLCENGKTGFDHRMGKEKPVPLKLQIRSKDINKWQLSTVHLKPARFNNFDSSGEETSIVSSTGNLLITWNFKKVKRGQLSSYKIRELNATAVDNQFQFDHPERVLVTDIKNVGVVNRKQYVKM